MEGLESPVMIDSGVDWVFPQDQSTLKSWLSHFERLRENGGDYIEIKCIEWSGEKRRS